MAGAVAPLERMAPKCSAASAMTAATDQAVPESPTARPIRIAASAKAASTPSATSPTLHHAAVGAFAIQTRSTIAPASVAAAWKAPSRR